MLTFTVHVELFTDLAGQQLSYRPQGVPKSLIILILADVLKIRYLHVSNVINVHIKIILLNGGGVNRQCYTCFMFKAFKPVASIDAVIACYPRSGSTYLAKLFEQRTLRHMKKSHDTNIDDNLVVVGIFREPVGAISSNISKELHFSKNISQIDNVAPHGPIARQASNYENHIKFLISRADCLIDFDWMVQDPESCVKKLSSFLGVDIVRLDGFVDDIENSIDDNFIKSSQALENYEKIRGLVMQVDLKSCYEIFNEAKESLKTIY